MRRNRHVEGVHFSKDNRLIYTSVTRVTDFHKQHLRFAKHGIDNWSDGDYVLCEVTNRGGGLPIELTTGRMALVMEGDLVIGVLGDRFATLEATGSWRDVSDKENMHMLTAAGLLGKLTSKSLFIPELIQLRYLAHVVIDGEVQNMSMYVPDIPIVAYRTPTVLFVGTSMSSGKTTSARITTRILKDSGFTVAAAKLSGAGRFRDILAMSDAGGDEVFDFIDVGLPSTIVDRKIYKHRAELLLSLIQNTNVDYAVIEVGASPLEPYNGDAAIEALGENVKALVLCASDPYAVLGVVQAFGIEPDIVTGPATNTLGGIELIRKLCGLEAVNLIVESNIPRATEILAEKLGFKIPA
jgi:hypothetical protein